MLPMVKGFRQIALLTVFSRILGFIRDISFAYFLGAGDLFDGWVIAFRIPNLARRIFGEGAASASFIPVYSEQLHKKPESANKLACTVVSVIFLILAVVVLLGEVIIWGYYTFFSRLSSTDTMFALAGIMLPYMILVCVVGILAGVLNAHRHFAAPAAAPIVLNIFIIGSLCFSGWVLSIQPGRQVFIVAVAVIAAGFTQLFMQLFPLRSRAIHIRPAWQVRSEGFKKIMLMMGPMILGLTATQINTLADDIIAKVFSGSELKGEFFSLLGSQIRYPLWAGAVSHLYYSQRLYQFPLGVLGISLATAIFPVMSADAARQDKAALWRTISRGLRGALFVALPATAGLILTRHILVRVAFERGEFGPIDSLMTAVVLSFYALGLCGFFLQQILARAFYSMQNSRLPAKTAKIAVLLNITLNLTFIWFMGTAGLALSTAICSYVQVILLLKALSKVLDGVVYRPVLATLVKSAVATVIMSAAGLAVLKTMESLQLDFSHNLLRLIVVVAVCILVYIIAARLLRIEMLQLLTGTGKKAATGHDVVR